MPPSLRMARRARARRTRWRASAWGRCALLGAWHLLHTTLLPYARPCDVLTCNINSWLRCRAVQVAGRATPHPTPCLPLACRRGASSRAPSRTCLATSSATRAIAASSWSAPRTCRSTTRCASGGCRRTLACYACSCSFMLRCHCRWSAGGCHVLLQMPKFVCGVFWDVTLCRSCDQHGRFSQRHANLTDPHRRSFPTCSSRRA